MKSDLEIVLEALRAEGAELRHLAEALGFREENLRRRLLDEGLTYELEGRIAKWSNAVIGEIHEIRARGAP